MFNTIANQHPRDKDYPDRTRILQLRRSILDGTFYEPLRYEFWESATPAGETISLSMRRPSVQYNLCRIVVQDSVSMLFGEGNFPSIDVAEDGTHLVIQELLAETSLPLVMREAAFAGSVGSACILMRILEGRVIYTRLNTDYLVPEWKPDAPDQLLRVTEKYKVRGSELRDRGYAIPEELLVSDHWFMRQWDENTETWFLPWPVEKSRLDPKFQPPLDEERTVQHELGFVPMVWIKNLPGGNGIDGCCTFEAGISTAIEIDYQLSQAGRGLKYSSEPSLVLKDPTMGETGEINKAVGQAIVVSEHGDAKLLEINGGAVGAVIDYVRVLRELALENIRGNRSSADKLQAAQSGRALELLHQSLVWLTGDLRTSYGEHGLLPLIRMFIAASRKMKIEVGGVPIPDLDASGLALRWPPIFRPTARDQTEVSTALKLARDSGNLSRESAVRIMCSAFDIGDPVAELARIEAEEEKSRKIQEQIGAQVRLTETSDLAPVAP